MIALYALQLIRVKTVSPVWVRTQLRFTKVGNIRTMKHGTEQVRAQGVCFPSRAQLYEKRENIQVERGRPKIAHWLYLATVWMSEGSLLNYMLKSKIILHLHTLSLIHI